MKKRMFLMLLLAALTLASIFGWKMYSGFKMYKAMMANVPHVTVSAAKAEFSDWQPSMDAVGTLRAAKGVDIASEVPGIVQEIHFSSGSDVKEGELLLQLRAEDEIARLRTLEAALKLAEVNLARDRKQLEVKAVSQATLDTDSSTLVSARAQVAAQQAIVEKKSIRAPFSGHLGIRNVDVGQYINPGTPMVTLQQLDPMYIDFYLPQQALAQIKPGQVINVKSDTFPNQMFSGTVSAVNPKVEQNTRNVLVRAEIPNPEHKLLPGMYVTASVHVGEKKHELTLPQTAITYNPYGNTVFIVNDKGKDEKDAPRLEVEQTFVTVGDMRGDQIQVVKGLKEGDLVVTSGQIKLQNGSLVQIDNSLAPKNDPSPQPKDE